MAYTHKPGQATLFRNESDNDRAPIYKGKGCCPACEKVIELAGWIATERDSGKPRLDRDGNKWLTLKLKREYAPNGAGADYSQDSAETDKDDTIDF